MSNPTADVADSALVICVGLVTSQCLELARSLTGKAMVVMVGDTESARRLLADSWDGETVASAGPLLTLVPDAIELPLVPEPAFAALRLDPARRKVTWRDVDVPLPAREFDLLMLLAVQPGRVFTFEQMTNAVWSRPYIGDSSSVSSAVKRLRRHLRQRDVGVCVESVRGVGFRLAA